MKRTAILALLLLSAGSLTGCMTMKSYVDPTYRKASFESIQRPAQPMPVKVDVQFLRNGKRLPQVDYEVRDAVERTLTKTGVFMPATADTKATISVSANNIADLAAARRAGIKTGLTLGGAGSTVQDNYEFICSYQAAAGAKKELSYPHVLHTTIGNEDPPAGMTRTTPQAGFVQIVQDVVLNFVKDLQDAGTIPKQ